MPVAARIAANEFIKVAQREHRNLTPLELLKLVYIAHGYVLAGLNRPLIREDVEAWRYGPVIPELYRAMRSYGSAPVQDRLGMPFYMERSRDLDDQEREVIQWVYRRYKKYNGINLSALTHAPGTPWSITWENQGQNAIIAPDLIREHYQALVEEHLVE